MSRLANDRNELYARHRAAGMMPTKAALAAGYASGSSTSHLEQDGDIIARIAEITEENASKREAQKAAAIEAAKVVGQLTGVGRAFVIQKLAEVAQLALDDRCYAESRAALELIGKDFGMFTGAAEDENKAVPRTMDLDALESVLDASQGALPPPKLEPHEAERVVDPSLAMELIEGQTPREKRRIAEDRKLQTGSETDIALMQDEDLLAAAEQALDSE
jgi:hypothetical protein